MGHAINMAERISDNTRYKKFLITLIIKSGLVLIYSIVFHVIYFRKLSYSLYIIFGKYTKLLEASPYLNE